MRRSRRHEFRQAYDAHTTVDADDGQLVLATAVARTPSDAPTVQAIVDALEAALGRCETILADAGFAGVKTERRLLSLADNCKRLRKLMAA